MTRVKRALDYIHISSFLEAVPLLPKYKEVECRKRKEREKRGGEMKGKERGHTQEGLDLAVFWRVWKLMLFLYEGPKMI